MRLTPEVRNPDFTATCLAYYYASGFDESCRNDLLVLLLSEFPTRHADITTTLQFRVRRPAQPQCLRRQSNADTPTSSSKTTTTHSSANAFMLCRLSVLPKPLSSCASLQETRIPKSHASRNTSSRLIIISPIKKSDRPAPQAPCRAPTPPPQHQRQTLSRGTSP